MDALTEQAVVPCPVERTRSVTSVGSASSMGSTSRLLHATGVSRRRLVLCEYLAEELGEDVFDSQRTSPMTICGETKESSGPSTVYANADTPTPTPAPPTPRTRCASTSSMLPASNTPDQGPSSTSSTSSSFLQCCQVVTKGALAKRDARLSKLRSMQQRRSSPVLSSQATVRTAEDGSVTVQLGGPCRPTRTGTVSQLPTHQETHVHVHDRSSRTSSTSSSSAHPYAAELSRFEQLLRNSAPHYAVWDDDDEYLHAGPHARTKRSRSLDLSVVM